MGLGLIDGIKKIFRKNQPRIATSDIVGYDTSLVYIPKYKDLAEKEKKIVDRYILEIGITKLENIIGYGNEVYERAICNTELLLNLFYQLTDKQTDIKFSEKTQQEVLKERLDEMIKQEELKLYNLALKKIEEEVVFRTIALEEIQKRKKKEFRQIGIFEKAERLQRKYENEQLEAAIERMKINKKNIEQQIQAIENTITNCGTIVQSIDVYNAVITSEDAEEKKKKVLEEKCKELLELANLVMPEKVEFEETNEDERVKIKQLAKIQRKLEIYAYTHRSDIAKLRQQVYALKRKEKTIQNKECLLKEINSIETQYKIFGRYITEELNELYKVKFDILTIDIDRQKESPLKFILNKMELKTYEKIVEEKIQQIIQGKNSRVIKFFGKEQLQSAINVFKRILKDGKRAFEIENILQNRTLLSLILAFDNENGLEKVHIDKNIIETDMYEDIFQWGTQIPVKSIFELIKAEERPITDKDNLYLRLYNMYNNVNKDNTFEQIYKVPEGVVALKSTEFWNEYHCYCSKLIRKLREAHKVILPSTLKSIGKGVFCDCFSLYEIEFNEGLEEICDEAFYGCWDLGKHVPVKMPLTLRKIGNKSFFNCYNIHIVLNYGLKEIGDYAFNFDSISNFIEFSYSVPQKELVLPSSLEKIGKDITNDTILKTVENENMSR